MCGSLIRTLSVLARFRNAFLSYFMLSHFSDPYVCNFLQCSHCNSAESIPITTNYTFQIRFHLFRLYHSFGSSLLLSFILCVSFYVYSFILYLFLPFSLSAFPFFVFKIFACSFQPRFVIIFIILVFNAYLSFCVIYCVRCVFSHSSGSALAICMILWMCKTISRTHVSLWKHTTFRLLWLMLLLLLLQQFLLFSISIHHSASVKAHK